MDELRAEKLHITGRVQGVGFRPYIYRLATQHDLNGWVCNLTGLVEIHIEGEQTRIEAFIADLIPSAPPLARPEIRSRESVTTQQCDAFEIHHSEKGKSAFIHVPPDQYACPDCLKELNDPDDRRYRYPFINCTQCGPRYTIIDRLPYDRISTSMAGFELCPACRAEYEDPLDRRFHAQPLACPECGPQLHFRHHEGFDLRDNEAALSATIEGLRQGLIIAIKGIGGYHLVCDASNDQAVRRLRHNKNRPHKPFAVMVAAAGEDGLAMVKNIAEPCEVAAGLVLDPLRPIVLMSAKSESGLAESVAPGLNVLGIMLPYSPLHTLITESFGKPLVFTSGNISGEPVLTEAADVEARLHDVVDAFLHHDRPIRRPVDDAIFQISAGKARPMRIGRGNSPLELKLPYRFDRPILAVGAHNKVAVALAWEDRVVVSQHLGNLDAPRTINQFERTIEDLQRLYAVEAEIIVCDAHPDYFSSRWARDQKDKELIKVYHHHAHASSLYGEQRLEGTALIFTWDGIGYGEDGTLWGGEALLGRPGNWKRVATFRPFSLPGAIKVAHEPWRSAQSLCWECDREWTGNPRENALLRHAWETGINSPRSSAVGRLFDAAAAFTRTLKQASFDGQAPMWLESISASKGKAISLPQHTRSDGVIEVDWEPTILTLLDESRSSAIRAADFHATMAQSLSDQTQAITEKYDFDSVGITGGVFQNHLLTEAVVRILASQQRPAIIHETIPSNDAGISFGQIIEAINTKH